MNKESVNSVVAKLNLLRISMSQEEQTILDRFVTGRQFAFGDSQEDEVSAHAMKDAVQSRNVALAIDDATQTYKLAD